MLVAIITGSIHEIEATAITKQFCQETGNAQETDERDVHGYLHVFVFMTSRLKREIPIETRLDINC